MAARADACLLVAREGYVRRDELKDAKDQLDKAGVRLLGVVANYCEGDPLTSYYRGHYGRSGARGPEVAQ